MGGVPGLTGTQSTVSEGRSPSHERAGPTAGKGRESREVRRESGEERGDKERKSTQFV